MSIGEDLEDWDGDDESLACFNCGRTGFPHEMHSCNGCGNQLCDCCAYDGEDDFGNVHCDPGCGL